MSQTAQKILNRFWEFLMLFIAITLGFFVENYREGLSDKEKEAAIWWSDDPDVTFSPAGHLYFITKSLVRSEKPSLISTTKIFARVGMSVADAFIKCWKWKYHFFSERPNTFKQRFYLKKTNP